MLDKFMKRRNVLIGLGFVPLAGCIGNEKETAEPTEGSDGSTGKTTEESESAGFEITDLTIEPTKISPGASTSVEATVENVGGVSGSYSVELQVNSNIEDTTEIELEPGEQEVVEFTFSAESSGSYQVSVGRLQKTLQVVAEPEMSIEDKGLNSADTVFHNSYAEARVENTGDSRSGTVELTVRWFDDSGSFVGEDSTSIPTLDTGESWVARVGSSKEENEISDYEFIGEYELTAGDSPDGISVANSSLSIEDEFSGRITAEAENTRNESLFMASFRGNIYNSEGDVIAGSQTLESDISAGEDLFFELSLSSTRAVHRIDKATDHQVLLTQTESSDTRNF